MDSDLEAIQVIPSGGPLAAEVRGVDLSAPLSIGVQRRLRSILWEHCVLVLRNQKISQADQVRFTRMWGRPVEHVRPQPDRPHKEIFVISNVEMEGRMGALGNAELGFHSDLSYMRCPGTISILHAVEVPRTGGATQWANCYSAYATLNREIQRFLQSLRAVHRHYEESMNPAEAVDHPVVRLHPDTDRPCLFVNPEFTTRILGLPESESRRLLDALFEHMTRPELVWTHEWRAGDIVVWDNRATIHRREPFPADERRVLHRTQIFNEETPQGLRRGIPSYPVGR